MRALIGVRGAVAAAVLASALAMVGCSTVATRERAAAEPSAQQVAQRECLFAALDTAYPGGLFSPYTVDREAYAGCMEAHGYEVTVR